MPISLESIAVIRLHFRVVVNNKPVSVVFKSKGCYRLFCDLFLLIEEKCAMLHCKLYSSFFSGVNLTARPPPPPQKKIYIYIYKRVY